MRYGLRIMLILCFASAFGIAESQAVLQSGSSEPQIQSSTEASPVANKRPTVKLTFKPKEKPQTAPYVSTPVSTSVPQASYTNYSYQQEAADYQGKQLSEDGAYEMSTSKRVHPLSAKPAGTSPVIQTVTGPKTSNYGAARPASVLYPGRPEGSMGTGRVQSRSESQSSNSGY